MSRHEHAVDAALILATAALVVRYVTRGDVVGTVVFAVLFATTLAFAISWRRR